MKISSQSLALVVLLAASTTAHTACRQVGNTVFCDDGSTYRTIGNTTYGSNSQTGTTWNQRQIGNSTYGNDSEGNSWSIRRLGNTSYITDSNGNSKTCRTFGGKVTCY